MYLNINVTNFMLKGGLQDEIDFRYLPK